MAESQKKASVSVSLTEKDSLLDLDIGNDFLSNWKSTSLAEGDALEFDLTPVSKGNKKSFNFGKEDMDFNLDGDFGKMSSFKMDMSLDISPPVKKDGKSKENMDMSDLDISSPLKKEGKSKENSKKSPSKKDKGKADCFAFGFDFDELDNFGFESSLTKEGSSGSGCRDKDDSKNMNLLRNMSTLGGGTEKSSSPGTATPFSTDFLDGGTADLETSKKTFSVKEASKDEKDEDSKENFPSGSARQDKEGSEYMNLDESVTRNVCLLEDVSKKPSLPGTTMPFDMDLLGGGIADLEPTRKTYPSNIMDDTCNSTLSASTDEVSSGKATILPETTDSKQPPRNSQHEKWISKKPVDLEAGTGNDAIEELSSDFVLKNDLSIGDPSEELDKDDSRDIIATRSNEEEEDVNGHFISGTTCNYKAAVSEHSEQLQTAAISEKGGKSKDGSEDNVMDNKEKSNPGPTDSIVANSCITRPVPRTLSDTSNLKNQGPVPEILKSPIVSRSADNLLSEKKTVNGRETLLASSRTSIQSDKPECPEQVLSTRATVLTLSSKRTGFNQPGLAEGGREWTSIQSDRKLASFPLQHSKMLTTKELPQMQGQERCREVHKADKLQNQKKLNDISANNKDMVNRTAARQRETHMKVVETLSSSMEINRKPEKSTGNPTAVASLPSLKSTHSKEDNVCSLGGGKKTPDIPGLKLSSLNLDSTNPPVPKAIRSVGSIIQHQVLLKNTASSAVQSADTRRQISTLSMKRKALDESTAETFVLHPSKRPLQSPTPSRNVVQASAKVPEVKAPEHNNLGDAHIKSTLGNCQVSTYDVANEVKMKEVETSFSTENDSNIKLAGAYTKELDDLCNMMRKKQEEAKELLVQAIVNSNKLLMLNNPLLDEKIRATQNIFARLTLNSIHG